jgi:hypothetical protein
MTQNFFFRDSYSGDSLLMQKYREGHEIYNKMTAELPDERPNCEEILRQINSWSLAEEEFDFENDFKSYSQTLNRDGDELSVISILESKLRIYKLEKMESFFSIEKYSEVPSLEMLEEIENIRNEREKLSETGTRIMEEVNKLLLEQNFDQNTKKIIGDCFKSIIPNEIVSLDVEKVKDQNPFSQTEQQKKCNKCLENIFNQMEEEFFSEKLVKVFANLFTQNQSETVDPNSGNVDENFISISKKKTIEKTSLEILKQNIDLTIGFMEKFPNHEQTQKKALLMLCNYRVLHSVSFDINQCVKLVVESLVNFEETDMNRMAIAICSILVHKLSNTEKSYLSSNSFFMNRLIDLIKIRFQYSLDQDIILNFIMILLKEINGYQSIESIYQNSKNDKIESFMSIYEKIMNKMEDMKEKGVFEKFSDGNENYNQEEIERNLLIIKEESLIVELLNKNREDSTAVIKNLNRLYKYLLIHCEPRNDLIDLIISLMQKHSNSIDVILISTACLYSFTRDKLAEKIEKNLIQNVFDATLSAMELYKDDQQLYTNGLSILFNEIILQDITFDKYKCVEIALNSLINFENKRIIERAIWICSGLTTKLTLYEKLNLFSKSVYIETLINILRISAHSPPDEFILYYTLSCLWNMTDRSPELCQIFLKKGGLNTYLIILNVSLEYKPRVISFTILFIQIIRTILNLNLDIYGSKRIRV